MNAIEAVTYCINSDKYLEDNEFHSQSVLDRNSRPHWVSWSETDGQNASPKLCSESFNTFAESLAPYRKNRTDLLRTELDIYYSAWHNDKNEKGTNKNES